MIVTPQLNILQRALNRATHRFGIKFFPLRFESSLEEAGQDPSTVFNAVYAANYWESAESASGGGSEISATDAYRPQLLKLLRELQVRSMFDAPCGDLNWMPLVLSEIDIDYIGGDIAEQALETARSRCPHLDIRRFDICTGAFPDVDLWHCRDTLFHLSFADATAALRNASNSKIRYAAITTHRARVLRNPDIKTGGFRLLDLERPPFNLPKPIRYLKDYAGGTFPRFVAVWPMDAIRSAVQRMNVT